MLHPVALGLLYLGVVLLPLFLAWASGHPPRSFWDEIASGAGLLAFAIILVEFILSGRFRSISGRVGMDVTMRLHQLLARSALVLALLHPFLYRSPFADPRPWDMTRELTVTVDFVSLAGGVLAWILLPVFVLTALARDRMNFKYETWRLMHGLAAVVISGLILHHTLHAGRYSGEPVLTGVWLAMFGLALGSLAFVYVIKPIGQLRRAWSVASVRPLGLKIWELTLTPLGHDGLKFTAGQFVWLNVGNSPFSLKENPFSIASAPGSGNQLQFVIKELGDFTRTIRDIAPGSKAHIDGPHGNLVVTGRNEPGIALIAGGVGIAPMLSILRQLDLEGDQRPVTLIYANRAVEQIVYAQEIEGLCARPGASLVHVLSEPPERWSGAIGMVDLELLRQSFKWPEARHWLFVLCGPAEMMVALEDALISLGVRPSNILSERFDYD